LQAVFQSSGEPYRDPDPGNNLHDLAIPVQSIRFQPPTTPAPVPLD